MTLLNTAAGVPNQSQDTTEGENIYAANAALAKPPKVSTRPVEPVPKFDWTAANGSVANSQGMAASGSVSGDSLVQNQLDKVLAKGGPLLTRAATDGLNASAEKGLNNTSMGVQAGEEAMIRSALPIAQQDASTYGQMDLANLNAKNQFGIAGLNQEFTKFNQTNQNNFTAGENDLDRTQKEDLFNQGNEFNKTMQENQNAFAAKNAEESDNRKIQADKDLSAANAKTNLDFYDVKRADDVADKSKDQGISILNNYNESVKQIMAQPGITPSQAQASIKMLNETTRGTMQVYKAISGVDLTEFLPQGTLTGSSTTDKKGVVTNTFDYQSAPQVTTTTNPAQQNNSAYMSQVITVPAANGRVSQQMTRGEAIARGYIQA